MTRSLVLLYGVVAYLIGVSGLLAIIAVLAGLMPWGFLLKSPVQSTLNPIVWNFLLVALWGFIHTITARASFKSVLIKLIPEPAERPTYTLIAGVTSIALVGLWRSLPGQVWSVELVWLTYLLWTLFIFGWSFLLAATFAINHFDLFGLRQVFMHYKQMPRSPLPFVKRAMYQYVRHPIQTGVLIGVWATPSMTVTQVILSIGFTIYIFIGLWFEERDLIKNHGDDYLQYCKETGKLFPRFGKH